MSRFWTADWHVNHGSIIKYAERPFKNAVDMRKRMVSLANDRVHERDIVVHVGDFLCRGSEKGNPPDERLKQHDVVEMLNGQWTFIKGNHDRNNGVITSGMYMVADVGKYRAIVSHIPFSMNNDCYHIEHGGVFVKPDFVICGHVHNIWKQEFLWCNQWESDVLHINVGVDSNKFSPFSDADIIEIYERHV